MPSRKDLPWIAGLASFTDAFLDRSREERRYKRAAEAEKAQWAREDAREAERRRYQEERDRAREEKDRIRQERLDTAGALRYAKENPGVSTSELDVLFPYHRASDKTTSRISETQSERELKKILQTELSQSAREERTIAREERKERQAALLATKKQLEGSIQNLGPNSSDPVIKDMDPAERQALLEDAITRLTDTNKELGIKTEPIKTQRPIPPAELSGLQAVGQTLRNVPVLGKLLGPKLTRKETVGVKTSAEPTPVATETDMITDIQSLTPQDIADFQNPSDIQLAFETGLISAEVAKYLLALTTTRTR